MCSDHLSTPRLTLCLRASSLCSRQLIHVSAGVYWPGLTGSRSLIARPKRSWAGERLRSLMGVFLCCRRAWLTLSQSGLPSDLVLVIKSLFAACDGCLTLHSPHLAPTAFKSAYIPGQNTVSRAPASMPPTPWYAVCKPSRTSFLSVSGTNTLLYFSSPFW